MPEEKKRYLIDEDSRRNFVFTRPDPAKDNPRPKPRNKASKSASDTPSKSADSSKK